MSIAFYDVARLLVKFYSCPFDDETRDTHLAHVFLHCGRAIDIICNLNKVRYLGQIKYLVSNRCNAGEVIEWLKINKVLACRVSASYIVPLDLSTGLFKFIKEIHTGCDTVLTL